MASPVQQPVSFPAYGTWQTVRQPFYGNPPSLRPCVRAFVRPFPASSVKLHWESSALSSRRRSRAQLLPGTQANPTFCLSPCITRAMKHSWGFVSSNHGIACESSCSYPAHVCLSTACHLTNATGTHHKRLLVPS
jgi:hypothetical protein